MTYTEDTLIRDLPLSIRTRNCFLYEIGPDATIRDAKHLSAQELLRVPNFGRKSLQEWLDLRDAVLNIDREADARQRRLEMHSMLLEHESAVIALYDIQRADADPDDFQDIHYDGTVAKRRETVARIREAILNQLGGAA